MGHVAVFRLNYKNTLEMLLNLLKQRTGLQPGPVNIF